MRTLLWAWMVGMMVVLVAGCGGGGHAALSSNTNILGVWLDVAPSDASTTQPDDGGCWPTHELTLGGDRSFTYVDEAVQNWVQGTFSVTENAIAFAVKKTQGTTTFFRQPSLSYALFDKTMAISEDGVQGAMALQLSRVVQTAIPTALVNDWLLVRRVNSSGLDLPCLASARMTIAREGTARLTRYNSMSRNYRDNAGTALVAETGHVGLRLGGADDTAGPIVVFGKCQISTGAMGFTGSDGVQTIYAARVAPSIKLVGRWERMVAGNTVSLALNSNSTFTLTSTESTLTGTWRNYGGSHLCLLADTQLRTFTWSVEDINAPAMLTLSEWKGDESMDPQYAKTVWTQVE